MGTVEALGAGAGKARAPAREIVVHVLFVVLGQVSDKVLFDRRRYSPVRFMAEEVV